MTFPAMSVCCPFLAAASRISSTIRRPQGFMEQHVSPGRSGDQIGRVDGVAR